MVSFQCHACGDVVKKPKLDQHHGRCHAGFDCIDCSTTFNTPAEYKGHTQCITEAEKYQKSLYKGPKTAAPAPRNNYPPQPVDNSFSARPSWPSRGGGGGYGGGWGRQRTTATGANDTPLGTPTRGSPLPTRNPPVTNGVDKNVEKKQNGPAAVAAPTPPVGIEKKEKEKEKEKEKKRKSGAVHEGANGAVDAPEVNGERRSKKVKVAKESESIDPANVPLPASPAKLDEEKRKKKSKKEKNGVELEGEKDEKKKRKKGDEKDGEDVMMAVPVDDETKEGKKSKKSKKEKKERDGGAEPQQESEGKSKDGEDVVIAVSVDDETKEGKKSKKSKKEKKEKEKGDEPQEESEGKSKKRKREAVVEGEGKEALGKKDKGKKGDSDAMEVDPPSALEETRPEKERKDKKDKKERKKDKKSRASESTVTV